MQAVNAKAEAVTNEVYNSVAVRLWHSSVAAFNQSAPPELKVTVAQMLDSPNENFIKAGAKIVAEFGRSSGLIPQQGAPLLNSASAGVQGQGLTREQFQSELRKIDPNSAGFEQAREALFARRALGKRSACKLIQKETTMSLATNTDTTSELRTLYSAVLMRGPVMARW